VGIWPHASLNSVSLRAQKSTSPIASAKICTPISVALKWRLRAFAARTSRSHPTHRSARHTKALDDAWAFVMTRTVYCLTGEVFPRAVAAIPDEADSAAVTHS